MNKLPHGAQFFNNNDNNRTEHKNTYKKNINISTNKRY